MSSKLSVLVAARKNSKYLAKFLHGYFVNTIGKHQDTEVLVMLNEHDTWNRELVRYYENYTDWNIRFFYEDYQLGRAGLHLYFNELYKHCTGQWIVYFCEDHYIIADSWDHQVRQVIDGTALAIKTDGQPEVLQHHNGRLNPTKIWAIIPKFDNAGAMNHIVSRGLVEQMGGRLAQHGNLDSYLNDVIKWLPRERRIAMDEPLFHDFTHDVPSPMSDAHLQSVISEAGKKMPDYDEAVIAQAVADDVVKLQSAIREGF